MQRQNSINSPIYFIKLHYTGICHHLILYIATLDECEYILSYLILGIGLLYDLEAATVVQEQRKFSIKSAFLYTEKSELTTNASSIVVTEDFVDKMPQDQFYRLDTCHPCLDALAFISIK